MVEERSPAVQSGLVTDPAILDAYRHDASPLEGSPDGLLRPASATEAAGWLQEAVRTGRAVTPCGLRSSTTGSGLAESGWSLSCERMTGLLDLDEERGVATVASGTVLGELKRELAGLGWLYPPDPTSEEECSLGGSVACDASGARTYLYGPTHRWVRGVELALMDGSVRWLRRREVSKDSAGFAGMRDLVQVLCGSEGTLGFITKVEVDLVQLPEAFLAGLAFFDTVGDALAFVGAAHLEARLGTGISPRCLELLDEGCLEIMRDQGTGLVVPPGVQAAIFFEEEHNEGESSSVLELWWKALEAIPGALPDDTVVAMNRASQEELRALRHAVPSVLNEEGRAQTAGGGRKISTDWAVPLAALPELVARSDLWLREAGIDRFVRYGHVGSGHPHYNLIVRDAEEARRGQEVVRRMCEEACALGGTVAAEHGLGKLKRDLATLRFNPLELAAMRAVKAVFDPQGLLAPGNLFPR